jgi:hypothetical protein
VRHHDLPIAVAGVAELPRGDGDGVRAEVDDRARQPQFRYPAVLALTFITTVFLIAAPTADWSRALAVAVEGTALVLTVATSRERASVRRHWSIAIGVGMIGVVVLIALGTAPKWLTAAVAIVITAGVPVALVRGLLRLLRTEGVTLNAVAGSLAIYLSVGLLFAYVIGFITEVSSTPYFTQRGPVTEGDKVYFSFTALTTTGFGDFTPATSVGHALAVIEMLTGQLYLVTVIGLLIGNFAGRRRAP